MSLALITNKALMVCAILAVCFFSGCGEAADPVGSISGKITLKGKRYSDCKVSIYCKESALALASHVDSEGGFEIENVTPGQYAVMVFPIPKETPEGNGPDPPDTSPIPKKFRSRDTTEVSVEVKADEVSEIEIELKK